MSDNLPAELLDNVRRLLDQAPHDFVQAAQALDALVAEYGSTLVTEALGSIWATSVASIRRSMTTADDLPESGEGTGDKDHGISPI
jgi:hypothetical protein